MTPRHWPGPAQALVATGRGRAWPGADDLLTDAGGPGLAVLCQGGCRYGRRGTVTGTALGSARRLGPGRRPGDPSSRLAGCSTVAVHPGRLAGRQLNTKSEYE
jgi:hypothetical protein